MGLIYLKERNADFLRVCEKIRSKNKHLSIEQIASQAISKEAGSYYIGLQEITRIINASKAEDQAKPKSIAKKTLWENIVLRYIELKEKHPNYRTIEYAQMIINSKAPRFYITEKTATTLYYKLLKLKQ